MTDLTIARDIILVVLAMDHNKEPADTILAAVQKALNIHGLMCAVEMRERAAQFVADSAGGWAIHTDCERIAAAIRALPIEPPQ